MTSIFKKSLLLIICAITSVLCLTSCDKKQPEEEPDPVHINELEELEDYEYKNYFSSKCEFGYKTYVSRKKESFVATQDNHITQLMSAQGVNYTAENVLEGDSYGLAFRLHFKGGIKIQTIEFDFKMLKSHKYVWPSCVNYATATSEQDYGDAKGLCFGNRTYPYLWDKWPHIRFKFNEYNNFSQPNPLADSIIIKFSETSSLVTSQDYAINISNLQITFVEE